MYFVEADPAYPNRTAQAWTQGEAQDNRFWFPSWDFPNDRFTTEIRVRVPNKYMALSNGRLLSETQGTNGRVFHWRMDQQHVNYLVTLVVGQFVKKDLGTYDGRVTLPVLVRRPHEADYQRSFSEMHKMLRFLEDFTGRKYPYSKYAQVVVTDFMWGGMENTTATTLSERTIHDERAASDWSSDGLILHELAHQWFGDLITCREWSGLWLNEGFATYLESLYFESTRGVDAFDYDRVQSAGWYLSSRYWRPISERRFKHPDDLFDGHAYGKAAAVLHMLRHTLGLDVFRAGVQLYVERHADGLVEGADLRRALEQVSGRNLKPFFEQWIERAGHPDITFEWRWNAERRMVVLDVQQTQEPAVAYDLTVPVVVHGSSGVRTHQLRISRLDHTFSFPYPTQPKLVEVDPRRHFLFNRHFEKSADELVYQMEHGSSVPSRRWAVEESGVFTDGAERDLVRAALTRVLQGAKEHYSVRKKAATRLAYGGDASARNVLLARLTKEGSSRVRTSIAAALGEYGDRLVQRTLLRVHRDDQSYKVSAAALRAYAATGAEDRISVAKRALSRNSHRDIVATTAVDILATYGGKSALRPLIRQTTWGRPHAVRRAAARALGTLGREHRDIVTDVETRLLELTGDRIWGVVQAAISGLRILKRQRTAARLEKLAKRLPTRRLRRAATEAAKFIRGESKDVQQRKVQERLDGLEERVRKLDRRLQDMQAR
jgi:aminopeptidase N